MAVFQSLPDSPVTVADTRALDVHEKISLCKPLLGLQPTPQESIVAIYLSISEEIRLLTYEEAAGGWDEMERFSATDSFDVYDSAIDHLLEWGAEYYGSDRIVFLDTESEQMLEDHIPDLFPDTPIGREHIDNLEALPGIETARAGYCYQDTHKIVAVLLFVDNILYGIGYDPTAHQWTIIDAVPPENLAADTTDLMETIRAWLVECHPEDRLAVVIPDSVT